VTAHYRLLSCGVGERPRRLPATWRVLGIGGDPVAARSTGLIYDSSALTIVAVVAPHPTSLHRVLLKAGYRPISRTPDRTIYARPATSRT
jgi:hypothetical protein